MCGPTDVACHVTNGFEGVINDSLGRLAESIGDTAMQAMNAVATFWVKLPTPAVATGAETAHPQNTQIVAFLEENVLGLSGILFTVAVLVAGMRTAWEQRARPLQELLKATLIFIAVSAAGSATLQLLIQWSDELSAAIIEKAAPKDTTLGSALGGMILQGLGGNQASGLLLMFAGVFVMLAGLVQVVLMLIRSAMLILLAGTFPLAAAATNTEIGRTWFRKFCSWALAFVAYKPAAALIYATALKMNAKGVATSDNLFVQAASGMMMLLLAIFALPALLRFIVPVTAAVAGGSSGMGAAAADPGGMATGAVNVGRSSFSGGGAGRGSSQGAASAASGGGASGAAAAGPAGAGLAVAGGVVNGARKAAGGVAGAAAHSAGEAGGGSTTPTSSFGSMSRGGSSPRSARSSGSTSSGSSGSSASSGSSGSGAHGARASGARPSAGQASRRQEHAVGPTGSW